MALNRNTGDVEAVGNNTKQMLGRTPGGIVAIKPLRDGVIADFKVAERMLNFFIKKAHKRNRLVHPRIVIGVPSETTEVEKRAVLDSAYRAKASEVSWWSRLWLPRWGPDFLSPNPAAIWLSISAEAPRILPSFRYRASSIPRSLRVAGNQMDDAIMDYVKRQYNLLIGERTAETIKIEIGSAYPLNEAASIEVKGRDLVHRLTKTIHLQDTEIREALKDCVTSLINCIRAALERTPPELSADIVDSGIVLTGGGALLKKSRSKDSRRNRPACLHCR